MVKMIVAGILYLIGCILDRQVIRMFGFGIVLLIIGSGIAGIIKGD